MKFYICSNCGNLIIKLNDSKIPVVCCGQQMTELIPGISDGAHEKHVPIIKQMGNKVIVQVGEIEHPMVEEHYIMWIILETTKGFHKFELKPFDKPVAEFYLLDEEQIICAYEYCNIHGLWTSRENLGS